MQLGEMMLEYRQQLSKIYDQREARSITEMVFEDRLQLKRHEMAFEKARILTNDQRDELEKILKRLEQHEPVQYVLGAADFCGLKLKVNSAVLIPRPETEELVEWITSLYPSDAVLRILDIGTGSGCIAIALAKKFPQATVEGCDVSEEALTVAHANNAMNNAAVEFYQLDILQQPLDPAKYDIIVSNPPYIAGEEATSLADNVVKHEPHLALFALGADDLVFYRAIAAGSAMALKPGGKLFFEIHEQRGAAVKALLISAGFTHVEIRNDINGKERMASARK